MTKTKLKTVYKLKRKNFAILLGILLLIALLCFGGYKIVMFIRDYQSTKEVIKKIDKLDLVENIVDDENTNPIKPPSTLSKFDSYWEYIKLGLIDVDMSKLKRINTETIGYLEVKETDFSYPIVQRDNDFYKKHSFDKNENSFGWVYLDEKNHPEKLDTFNRIYGNKILGNMLMSNLNVMFKEEWNTESDNFVMKYYTNDYTALWQIISVYKSNDKDHEKNEFADEKELQEHIDKLIKKSQIKFKAEALATDKFLILSTNSKNENVIVLAKLIKIKTEQ